MDHSSYFALKSRFTPVFRINESHSSPSFWFIFHGDKLLMDRGKDGLLAICTRSPEQLDLKPTFSQFLGRYDTIDCFVAEVEDAGDITNLPQSLRPKPLRSLFGTIEDDHFLLAGRAIQVLHWHREHLFCGKCGTRMEMRDTELAKICPACSFVSFPRLSPAVIMSVVRNNHILLARAPHFPKGVYSTLAGFVEPGETLEEAVKREVQEEVNIRISGVRYVASQPWPFPHSIMIGFSANYVDGQIKVDRSELEDARWFSVQELPPLPSRITIARLLIDTFIAKCSQ